MTDRHEAQTSLGLGPEFSAISAPDVLNEAHAYARPSSFSRGMRLDLSGAAWWDIERDNAAFDQLRTWFLARAGCGPLPASTAIQARLCRRDLLVEIEAIAVLPG